MPIFEIKALPQGPGIDIQAAMKRLCIEIAALMKVSEHQVWATWQIIEPGWFVEGGKAADIQPPDTHAPIVNLIAFEGRDPALMEQVIMRATDILTSALKLSPGNIYMHFTETLSGRTYTGGELRRRK
jgi:hypothetical protein